MTESTIISKIWNMANVLRDDGVSYGDYLEQITYLLFLKMADEMNKPPYNKGLKFPHLKDTEGKEIPDGEMCDWETLTSKRGAELEAYYVQMLRSLGTEKGMLGQIYTKSQNKIQDPAKLLRVIEMINRENWSLMGSDVKGKIYEGLLEKNAEDTKSGAGQYFTPRALIRTMVACVRPKPEKTIIDPACGTGGFFLASYDYIAAQPLNKDQKLFLKKKTFFGNEIVANTRRLCLMKTTELHTILRLPTGIFYANGVKANVLFFDNRPASKEVQTKEIWIYDYRTNIHHTLKKSPLTFEDLSDFIKCYNPENRNLRTETWSNENPEGRWRKFTYEEIIARDKTNLDIFWIKDKSLTDLDNLPEPDEIASEIIENLEEGIAGFKKVLELVSLE